MQSGPAVIQQNCHHKCQSLWPQSTQTEPSLPSWGLPGCRGWQTWAATPVLQPLQPPEAHVSSPPRHQPSHLSGSFCYPQLALWLPACLSSVDTGNTAGLSAHFTLQCTRLNDHYFGCLLDYSTAGPQALSPSIYATIKLTTPSNWLNWNQERGRRLPLACNYSAETGKNGRHTLKRRGDGRT